MSHALTVRTTAPTADGDGTALNIFDSKKTPTSRPARLWLRVDITGGTATLQLFCKDGAVSGGGKWILPTDLPDPANNASMLFDGSTLAVGSYAFLVHDVAHCDEIALLATVKSGSPTFAATITNLIETTEAS